MKVYLVVYRRTGEVLAVFANAPDAKTHVERFCPKSAIVQERTVVHGPQFSEYVG